MIEQIEKIKSEYTDKYVVVDAERPELARFRELVGQVKTVNMSGRALVEFIEYNVNIGWFDIDLDYLKVVDKPAPKPKEAKKPPAKKPAAKKSGDAKAGAGEKKLSPLEMARQQGAGGGAKKADKPASGKPSTADILAAARGGGKPSPSGTPAAEKAEKTDATPAAAQPAKPSGGKMSTADILAAARGGAKPPAAEAEPATTDPPAPEPEPEAPPEPAAEASAPADGDAVRVDKASMSIDDMIAYCREHDAE